MKTAPRRHACLFLLVLQLVSAIPPAVAGDDAGDVTRRPRADGGGTVRVVSANLRVTSPNDYKTGNGWNQRRELCRDVLLAQDADIYCFQECRDAHLDFIKKGMPGFEHFAIPNSPAENTPPSPTLAILYATARFKKVRAGGFWFSDTPEKPGTSFDGAAYSRMANWLLLQDLKTGRILMVWNTHLDEAGGAKGAGLREKQARQLVNFAAKIPPGIPQVITGDMNAAADSKAMRDIIAAGWIDTWAALHGPGDPGRTHHGFEGPKAGPGGKIDFVLCNDLLKPAASEIIRDSRKGRHPSDHYFVSADMEYAPARR